MKNAQQIIKRIEKLEARRPRPTSRAVDLSDVPDWQLIEMLKQTCEHPAGSLKAAGSSPLIAQAVRETWNVPAGRSAMRLECSQCGYGGLFFDVANVTGEHLDEYTRLLVEDAESGKKRYRKGDRFASDHFAAELIEAGHLNFVTFTRELGAFYETNGGASLRSLNPLEWRHDQM